MASWLEDNVAIFGRNYEERVGVPVQADSDNGCYLGELELHKHREPPAIIWVPVLSNAATRRAGSPQADDPREDLDVKGWREFAVEIWCYGETLEQADALHRNTIALLNDDYGDEDLRLGQFEVVSETAQKAAFNLAGASIRQRVYLRTYVPGYIDHTSYTASTINTATPSNTGHTVYLTDTIPSGTPSLSNDCGH
jgi:hypothetical protein